MSLPVPTGLSACAEKLIRGRHATRAFRPDPVPEDTLRAVFALAGAAPSNSNAQPWRVEVASGARRDRLARALRAAHEERRTSADFPCSEDMYAPVHHERRAAYGAGLYGALGVAPGDHAARAAYDAESLDFYGAPHVAFLFATGDGGARLAADAGAYLQTLLLALTVYGVDSCPQGLLTSTPTRSGPNWASPRGSCSSASPSVTPTKPRR
ncbi:nitroreductase family protein [Streptomyces sp. HNM0574]|uniref:nitroreductase family protein n=1 Tax=Streptomyces sp. HNM0574 TaxID=2714954 RepID=UPI001F0CE39F|nr:nitroreductase family protein [Streptomyces sp. HNM0574]